MAPQTTLVDEARCPPTEQHDDSGTPAISPACPLTEPAEVKIVYANTKSQQTKESQHRADYFGRNPASMDNKYISIGPVDEDDSSLQCSDTSHHPDVDGGWAWVVFAASFLQFLISSGMYYSFSVFFVELLQTFGESRAKTGWVYSTNSAIHMFSGPLGGFVIVHWGPRTAVMLGGLLAGLGYLLTAFAPNLNTVFITYSFINAIGTSLNFSGWIVGLSRFWEKHHSLVVGLAMSGSGCGLFLLGPFMESIVHHLGWRGAMLICAGLSFNFCVFGATIYDIKTVVTDQNHETTHSVTVGVACNDKDNTAKHLGDSNANVSSKHLIGTTDLLESPSLASQIVLGSSLKINEICHDGDKLERIKYMIISVKDYIMSRKAKCKSSQEDNAEKESVKQLLFSPTFWLLEASCFLSFMATTTVFAVFLDWTCWKGLEATFPHALAGSGAGDLVGRLLAGAVVGRGLPPLILFSGIQLLLATTIGCATLASTSTGLISSMVGFGTACGLQSVLYALMPSQLSSGVGMARVLGYLLLVTGAGALTGPPLAGLLVDLTESYNPVLLMCAIAPAAAAIFNFAAHFTSQNSRQSHNAYTSPHEQNSVQI